MRCLRLSGGAGITCKRSPSSKRFATACSSRQAWHTVTWASSAERSSAERSPSIKRWTSSRQSRQFMTYLTDHASQPQPLQDFQAGAVQPGLDGPYRTVHGAGDFLIRLAVLVEQNKDHSVVGPKLLNGGVDFPA